MSQIKEFKEYFSKQKISEISFWSENQEWYSVADPCKLRLTFTNMLIYENPNIICLKSSMGSLCLDRVKSVEYSTDSTPLGILITVVCIAAKGSGKEKVYTLIAS